MPARLLTHKQRHPRPQQRSQDRQDALVWVAKGPDPLSVQPGVGLGLLE